jgi:hypothetical protein
MGVGKLGFNWSLLTRDNIAGLIWSLHEKLTKKELSPQQFHSILSNHIRQHIPVKIKKVLDIKVDSGQVWIGGTYYSDYDQDNEKCIEVWMVYRKDDSSINLTKQKFNKLCYTIADTVLHEIIHMRQFRRRKFKNLPDYPSNASRSAQREEQSYIGNSDEIDAYGFNIACELMDQFNNDTSKIIKYLNLDQKGSRTKFNTWKMYLRAFDHEHDHPIIKRVKKKVIRYLPLAEIGKPYRNQDWIFQ